MSAQRLTMSAADHLEWSQGAPKPHLATYNLLYSYITSFWRRRHVRHFSWPFWFSPKSYIECSEPHNERREPYGMVSRRPKTPNQLQSPVGVLPRWCSPGNMATSCYTPAPGFSLAADS